ncbi:hypothetical protein ACO0QE_003256 [Hanseniaspora vineae]
MNPFEGLDNAFLASNKQLKSSYRRLTWNNLKSIEQFLKEAQEILVKYPTPNEKVKLCVKKCFEVVLQKYPLFFGYWKKYAAITLQLYGAEEQTKVLQKSVQRFPTSLELWQDYLTVLKEGSTFTPEIKKQFDTAASLIGNHFMSEPFWDLYISFITESITNSEEKDELLQQIYEKVTSIPLYSYAKFYKQYQTFIQKHPQLNIDSQKTTSVFQKVRTTVNTVWAFESKIKQPFFTIGPMKKPLLDNWDTYLTFLLGPPERHTLQISDDYIQCCFERCLIPCHLYEFFWVKYHVWFGTRYPDDDKGITKLFERSISAVPQSIKLKQLYLVYRKSKIAGSADLGGMIKYLNLLQRFLQQNCSSKDLFNEYVRVHKTIHFSNKTPAEYEEFLEFTINDFFKITNKKIRVLQDEFLSKNLINDDNIDMLVIELVRSSCFSSQNIAQTRKYYKVFGNRKQLRKSHEFWLEYYKFERSNKNVQSLLEFIERLGVDIFLPTVLMNDIVHDFHQFFLTQSSVEQYTKLDLSKNIDPLFFLDMKLNNPKLFGHHQPKMLKQYYKSPECKELGHPGVQSERPIVKNSIMKKNSKRRTKQKFDLPAIKNINKISTGLVQGSKRK